MRAGLYFLLPRASNFLQHAPLVFSLNCSESRTKNGGNFHVTRPTGFPRISGMTFVGSITGGARRDNTRRAGVHRLIHAHSFPFQLHDTNSARDTSLSGMHLFLRWRITEIIYSFPRWRKSLPPRLCIDISSHRETSREYIRCQVEKHEKTRAKPTSHRSASFSAMEISFCEN